MVRHIDAWHIALNICQAPDLDLDTTYPKDRFGPGDSAIYMDEPAFLVKHRDKETPETKNNGVYSDKEIQAKKPYHQKTTSLRSAGKNSTNLEKNFTC
jgi:hypothetical protein